MGSKGRRRAWLGMVAGAALMAMAGTAFACTEIRAQIEINGVSGLSSGSATYVGNGGEFDIDSSAGYCDGKPPRLTMTSSTPGALVFNLAVAPGTCGTETRKLPANVYQVRWVAAEDGEIDNTAPFPKCHFPPLSGYPNNYSVWVPIGVLSVDANGNGSGTYELTAAMAGPGNICLDDSLSGISPPVIPMKWTI